MDPTQPIFTPNSLAADQNKIRWSTFIFYIWPTHLDSIATPTKKMLHFGTFFSQFDNYRRGGESAESERVSLLAIGHWLLFNRMDLIIHFLSFFL